MNNGRINKNDANSICGMFMDEYLKREMLLDIVSFKQKLVMKLAY